MSYRFTNVQRFKRGAHWSPGKPRMCTRCAYEDRPRRRQAIVTALLQRVGSKTKTPVAYCDEHVPEEIT